MTIKAQITWMRFGRGPALYTAVVVSFEILFPSGRAGMKISRDPESLPFLRTGHRPKVRTGGGRISISKLITAVYKVKTLSIG